MQNFTYFTPTKVVFGKGAEEKSGELIKKLQYKKALLHYGSGSVVRSGLLDRVKSALSAAGIEYAELGGVVPNPRLSLVYEGIALAKKENVDFILAIGGGSAIDSAKAIGFGIANEGDVWDFYAKKRKPLACAPIGAILTIAAAGSEMSDSSVITKEEGMQKRGLGSDLCRPVFAIMNPDLTLTLPDYQTASGCVDILMHTLERYFHREGHMEITDAMSEALLRTVMEQSIILRDNPLDYNARAEVMWAGSLSHNGLLGCGTDGGDWATHRLEHELGGLYDVAHGAGLSALFGSWARHVFKHKLDRFVKLAVRVMGVAPGANDEETALLGIAKMEAFFKSIRMPVNMRELGVSPSDKDIEWMVNSIVGSFGTLGVIKKLDALDMTAIYTAAR